MDDIGKGEKYLGNWSDNKKHGCGLIVTLDGIYYEGLFMQDVLTVSILLLCKNVGKKYLLPFVLLVLIYLNCYTCKDVCNILI